MTQKVSIHKSLFSLRLKCMSVKSSTELMLYVVLTMPTLNKAYLFIYLLLSKEHNISKHYKNTLT